MYMYEVAVSVLYAVCNNTSKSMTIVQTRRKNKAEKIRRYEGT